MNESRQKPLIIRILKAKMTWACTFMVVALLVMGWNETRLGEQVLHSQGQFVADNVRNSAVECFAIEGRFPDTAQGVQYLEDNYGLTVDHKRYLIYYESMGNNIIPQIRVIAIPQSSPVQEIAKYLGLSGRKGLELI